MPTKLTARYAARPGPGWKYLGSSVWEHENGVRVHVSARLVMFKDKEIRNIYQISGAYDLYFLLQKINGNNPKRAMLALAMSVVAQ